MLWSHSLPGQQVQFQLSLIVIMNLCTGDNNSLHPFIKQGKSPWFVPRKAAFKQHSHKKAGRNELGLALARSLRLQEIKQHIYWMPAIRVGSNKGQQRHPALFTHLPTIASPSNRVITGRTSKSIFYFTFLRADSAYPNSPPCNSCYF